MTLRVFIYGSCVTRDAVEFWDPEKISMAGYIARQSLISANSAPSQAEAFRLSQIESSFQRRMLRGDVESSLLPTLIAQRDDYDVILWDLTDERNGVQRLPDGGWVTRLRNFQKEQLFRGKLGEVIGPDSDAYAELWLRSLSSFLERLAQEGLRDRLVLNDTRWAATDEKGSAFTETELALNAHLPWMAGAIRAAGVPSIAPHPEAVIASSDHKWNRAPFHYVRQTYDSMSAELVALRTPR